MTDLITKMESAAKGSRELDEDVACAIGWKVRIGNHGYIYIYNPDGNRVNGEMNMGARFSPSTGEKLWDEQTTVTGWADECDLPHYTTSIDAALTLVPDRWEWRLEYEDGDDGIIARCEMGDPMLRLDSEAATPALALCIAALKAREAEDGQG